MRGDTIEVYLAPGGFHFGGGDTRIRTLLGSCVAITMWHPRWRLGGMCHYVLPGRGRAADLPDGRYAEDALRLFLGEIGRTGTLPEEYEVKLFGGGRMLGAPLHVRGIGERNVEAGRQLLLAHGLRAHRAHLAGVGHRSVVFDLATGQVWVRHVTEALAA